MDDLKVKVFIVLEITEFSDHVYAGVSESYEGALKIIDELSLKFNTYKNYWHIIERDIIHVQ